MTRKNHLGTRIVQMAIRVPGLIKNNSPPSRQKIHKTNFINVSFI